MMDNCLFCKIVTGDIPAKIVYQDDHLIAIEDIAPVAPVHFLIIPRRHLVNTLDLSEGDAALVGHVHLVAATLAREAGIAEEGFRIVTNSNAAAGQSVFHIHFHLIGGRNLGWPPG